MSATDALLSRYQVELDERRTFMDGLVEAAESEGRDLSAEEMELYTRARDRMRVVSGQMEPLSEGVRIGLESKAKTQALIGAYAQARDPQAGAAVEYRSAGAYITDLYYARTGDDAARGRLEVFNRVAAHQTTPDNPGLLPEQIVGPVVNFVDQSRPLVASLNPTDLGNGSWAYARVTQHTLVGAQAAEKTELPSRKMTITKTPISAPTYGGYVNVSRQDIDRTSPAILDMVVNDLAGQYAVETELAAATDMTAAATAGPTFPAAPTGADIAAAVYGAVGLVFGATKGQGTTYVAMSPDMLGIIGPIFPPVNPGNAFSSGFSAAGYGTGSQPAISGIPSIMSAGLPAGTILVYSTAAVHAFEHRYGALQVVEPSVWGTQVGYAGDYETAVYEPTGIVKVTAAP